MNYSDDYDDNAEIVLFELTEDDQYAIDIAIEIARYFLKKPSITPKQIIGLGNALYALDRMPAVTPGVNVDYGITYRHGTDSYSEMRYIDFRISDSDFSIDIGASTYDSAIGSDSFTEPGWAVELWGYRDNGCDLDTLEDKIMEYLNLGAEITVDDESEIEFEDTDDESRP